MFSARRRRSHAEISAAKSPTLATDEAVGTVGEDLL